MRIAIYSTMFGMPWGGSEELWSRAATVLLGRGHEVFVNYRRRKQPSSKLDRLVAIGARVHHRRGAKYGRSIRRLLQKLHIGELALRKWLRTVAPDLVLVSIGYHTDEVLVARACQALGIPYALLLQAASPYQGIEPSQWQIHHDAYSRAAACFFVSAQNRTVIETNLALDLSAARIVDNPFTVPVDAAPAWPDSAEAWKLACVARLHFGAKGQDLLIQALAQPKWRRRPLEITLFGDDGGSRRHIERLISLYSLERQIKFGGMVDDIQNVWRQHHALVLPSRFEGNSLALIEAMLCARAPIVTNVGRAAELIDDNESGFIAPAATMELVDDALERAWQRRDDWRAMGERAARDIRSRHSLTPAEDFADSLLGVAAAPGAARNFSRAA